MTLLPLARYALFWALMHPPAPSAPETLWGPLRLVQTPRVHLGVRPAASWGEGLGLSVQLTLRTPW